MAVNGAFSPQGLTTVVINSAVQIAPNTTQTNMAYRVRNLAATVQYFTHGSSTSVTSLTPAAGAPSLNTIGMLGGSVEVFANLLPFMIASTATGFEVTPGDGL